MAGALLSRSGQFSGEMGVLKAAPSHCGVLECLHETGPIRGLWGLSIISVVYGPAALTPCDTEQS